MTEITVYATATGERNPRALRPDDRFRALVGPGWQRLPRAVRRRFSRKTGAGQSVVYAGRITENAVSPLGHLLARLCVLIGGPLPVDLRVGGAAVVAVTEEGGAGGQVWTRLYARPRGFPQVIHSAKRFAGPTGLEEHVGCGVGMALTVTAGPDGLIFRSARYFLDLPGARVTLPRWLAPGDLTVRHRDAGDGRFDFILTIDHPRFGRLIAQTARFEEVTP